MKLWFAKFRISTALDAKQPLPPPVKRAVARSDELRRFVENSNALDYALKASTLFDTPPELHGDIMRAVRLANRSEMHNPVAPLLLRWVAASAVATLVVLGMMVFILLRPMSSFSSAHDVTAPLAAATAALNEGSQMVHATPAAVMEPLAVEWVRMHRDLNGAAGFLIASLP